VGVFTAEDLPTKDALINSRNNAVLAQERTLWVGQPVAVVVAESEAIASDAADKVMVYLDPQSVVTDVMEAIKPDAPKVWPDGLPTADDDLSSLHGNTAVGEAGGDDDELNNLHSKNQFVRGDVEKGFAESESSRECSPSLYGASCLHRETDAFWWPQCLHLDPKYVCRARGSSRSVGDTHPRYRSQANRLWRWVWGQIWHL